MATSQAQTGSADIQDNLGSLPKPAIGTKKRRPKGKKQKTPIPPAPKPAVKEYLKIDCPSNVCSESLLLMCPFCHEGALSCPDHPYFLECDTCRHKLRAVKCSCGFEMAAPYVHEKQKKLATLLAYHDPAGYYAIFITFGILCLTVGIMSLF